MTVIKTAGKITGAHLTRAEQQAMKIEIAKATKLYVSGISATVLWTLHEEFGFGKERLYRYFKKYNRLLDELSANYQMSEPDEEAWLCKEKLKGIGVDLEEWENDKKIL